VDIFDYRYIFFPVHKNKHWSLVVANVPEKRLHYYDSMNGSGEMTHSDKEILNVSLCCCSHCISHLLVAQICAYFQCLEQYLKEEWADRKMEQMSDWTQALAQVCTWNYNFMISSIKYEVFYSSQLF